MDDYKRERSGAMNVLVGCEFSGVVREAFRRRGHNAWSCDLLPAADDSRYHIQADLNMVLNYPRRVLGGHPMLGKDWDLGIFHPPCTRLTNAGVRWLYKGGRGKVRDPQKWRELREAAYFFEICLGREGLRNVRRRAIENPIMHEHATELINYPYTQIVQPWMFGHKEMKALCLWLEDLPPLEPTDVVGPPPKDKQARKSWARVHREPPGPDRWKRRSITYQGLADAMAEQWGSL